MDFENTIEQVGKIIQIVIKDKKIIEAIQLIKAFDKNTYLHCKNVAYNSTLIALMMKSYINITEDDICFIAAGGFLHDVGKVFISNELVNKKGKLNPLEYEKIKKHSILGYQYCKDNNFSAEVAKIVLEHHERIDGSGYPFHLKNNEIYIGSKIVAAVDIMDAIKRERSYKPSKTTEEALKILNEQKGISLDRKVTSTIYNINELFLAGRGELKL